MKKHSSGTIRQSAHIGVSRIHMGGFQDRTFLNQYIPEFSPHVRGFQGYVLSSDVAFGILDSSRKAMQ